MIFEKGGTAMFNRLLTRKPVFNRISGFLHNEKRLLGCHGNFHGSLFIYAQPRAKICRHAANEACGGQEKSSLLDITIS